ncbi:hypothetical protein K437DRAFT_276889 [Tilletiaria anomala UBC 951]|uniref:Exosome complex component CSL4 C-terminal domain-containing protein n=1 Tax=Tilletiaria anomala (strain ATCC 24038 / CBS 436.72 / UBC 951) TaxID=1037660 RepID=A0A066VBE1_TILAU|nr:uncharacterized protein K437DRAFT_276889 [Tilletiaria anomala UBC 951]KDN36084.1 hypothetical protein K437DRAFT_276889 [Tilletiaria anomala UBC 951]
MVEREPMVALPGQPLAGPSTTSESTLPSAGSGSGTYRRGPFVLSSLVGRVSCDTASEGSKAPIAANCRLGLGGSMKGKGPANTANIDSPLTISIKGSTARFTVPETDSVVLARITRVSPREARCAILVVNGVPCGLNVSSISSSSGRGSKSKSNSNLLLSISASDDGNPDNLFQGVIRSQDVRATNKDSVRMNESFRPGDIVRAIVISLGDARSYYLSTASNELGVVYAIAASSTAPDYILIDDDLPSSSHFALGEAANASAPRAGAAERKPVEIMSRPSAVPLQPLNWAEMRDPTTGAIEKRKVAKPLVV